MFNRSNVGALVVVAVLLAGGCGGGASDDNDGIDDGVVTATGVTSSVAGSSTMADSTEPTVDADALIVDGELNPDALDSLVADFVALDEDSQRERINELAGDVERHLYELSGLTEALGGPETVDQSIGETAQWLADLAGEVTTTIESADLRPQGIRGGALAADGVSALAAGLAGGFTVTFNAGAAAVSATNDGLIVDGELGTGVRIKSTKNTAEMSSSSESTDSTGVKTTLVTRSVVTPCPGPDGTFEASALVDTSSTINNGAIGKRLTIDVTIKGTVDDDASLVGYDMTSRAEYADFAGGQGKSLDVTLQRSQGEFSAEVTGAAPDDVIRDVSGLHALLANLAAVRLSDAARIGWESGRCVELKPTVSAGPAGLAPSASVTLTAAPLSKIDGQPTGGTVTALLTGGEAAVDPSSTPVSAPAQFTYTAPDQKDKTGAVSLEARSRRGVARATIDFDTKAAYAYQIAGGLDDFQTDTVVCDVLAPFTLSGGGISVDFSGGLTGTYTYSGVFGAAGGGEYQITLPEGPGKPGTMIGGGEGSVEGGFSATGTENYVLTPITC